MFIKPCNSPQQTSKVKMGLCNSCTKDKSMLYFFKRKGSHAPVDSTTEKSAKSVAVNEPPVEDQGEHNSDSGVQDGSVMANGHTPATPWVNQPAPTEKQIELLNDNWAILQDHVSKVGVITFIGLFETHPDVRDAFLPFRNLTDDDLRNSEILRAHGLRVMRIVEKSLGRIHEPQKLESLLHELGKKHVGYNAKANYIDLMGPQFIAAIKPALEGHWNSDVEDAWTALFRYMAHIMKEGMQMAPPT